MQKRVAVKAKTSSTPPAEEETRQERAARLLHELYELCASGAVHLRKPSDEVLRAAQPERDQALESEKVYLLTHLSRGYFSTVHSAFWSRKNVLVAVKIMSKSKMSAVATKFVEREIHTVKART